MLPAIVPFEGIQARGALLGARMFYRKVAYRAPLKGEWYLSGAIVQAYRAPNDLLSAYWVVEPTHYVDSAMTQKRGAAYR
jgi:hypothetical protein